MPLQILSSPSASGETKAELERAIAGAFPDARVDVEANGPGHFSVRVACKSFEGQSRVRQQQRVYAAIAPLMQGDAPPVHAIDRLITEIL